MMASMMSIISLYICKNNNLFLLIASDFKPHTLENYVEHLNTAPANQHVELLILKRTMPNQKEHVTVDLFNCGKIPTISKVS